MKKMSDVVKDTYTEAGNPLDPKNPEMAKGFFSSGLGDKYNIYKKKKK